MLYIYMHVCVQVCVYACVWGRACESVRDNKVRVIMILAYLKYYANSQSFKKYTLLSLTRAIKIYQKIVVYKMLVILRWVIFLWW